MTARPITTSGTLQTDRSVRPASSAPAPTISTSEATIGRLERSSLVCTFRRTGITSTVANAIAGRGTRNAHRQPIVSATRAPSDGPSSPGRIHIEASSAITRGRMSAG